MGNRKTRRRFSAEFKADAVALVQASGKPVTRIASELGVGASNLGKWVEQARIDAGEMEGVTIKDNARLKELEQEVRILKMEREILKRAEAFWVKEQNG